jgi:serine/threonine protein kinase/tetratricopeptide (TPR) repeat protein
MDQAHLVADRYQIEGLIGQGGMGVVYRAIDRQTGHAVALKQLNPYLLAKPETISQNLTHEAEMLRQLDHPHIITLHKTIVDQDSYYLVMPFIEGGSLADRLEQQPQFPLTQALQIALDLADALNQAHQLNIIHCDIKPSNVLLQADGSVLLTDFGTAHILYTGQPDGGHTLGTQYYMSPEAIAEEPLDARSDIWSLGILLYEMLAGEPPFARHDGGHLQLAILTEMPPDLQRIRPDVSDRLADLIYRMLAKNREQRIPNMRLVGLELEVLLNEDQAATTRFATHIDSLEVPHFNLPFITSPCFGREAELAQIDQLLNQPHNQIITLHGPGGVGKTRLALEVALGKLESYQHGVYFVDLTTVDVGSQIAPAIADAIQFSFFGNDSQEQQLLNFLQNKELLLILDNMEHVVDEADLLARIVESAAAVRLIITSQQQLGLSQEKLLSLSGLRLAADGSDETAVDDGAFQLFVQSARRVRPDYQPDAEERHIIRQICQFVDGLPLGIELAAAWMNVLSPLNIKQQMEKDLDFLTSLKDEGPLRHRSLRAVFEYSWRLLNRPEQQTLQGMALFQGSFSREAAHRVVAASPLVLNALVGKSLLYRMPASGRYAMQTLLQKYAGEKLADYPAEAEQLARRHAYYYLHMLQQHGGDLVGGRQMAALVSIEREMANVQAAWRWAIVTLDEAGLRLGLDALFYFYQLRGRQQQGAEMFAQAARGLRAADTAVPPLILAQMIARQGAYYRFIGRLAEAEGLLEESLALVRAINNEREIAFVLVHLGATKPNQPEAYGYWQESLKLAEQAGDQPLIAESLNWLSFAYYQQGELDTAVSHLERSLAIRRQLKDRHGLANGLTNLGLISIHHGRYERARTLLQEALQTQRGLNNWHGMAHVCTNLSYIALNTGDYKAAEEWAQQALSHYREVGDKKGEGLALGNLSEAALLNQQYEKARLLCQQCISLYQRLKLPTAAYYNLLGRIALAQNDFDKARDAWQQALSGDLPPPLALDILTGVATILAQTGETTEAVPLFHFIISHPVSEQLIKERATREQELLHQTLSSQQIETLIKHAPPLTLSQWLERIQKKLTYL